MACLTLSFLGPPLVEQDGRVVELQARKAVALLAYLAVAVKPQSRDLLASLFWPDSDQQHARGALRYTLATLKRAIGERWIVADRNTVGLDWSQDIRLDVERLRRLPPPTAPPDQLIAALGEAAALYRGDFLSGLALEDSEAFEDWQRLEAESLRQRLAQILEALVGAYRAQRQLDPAIAYARRWLALDAWHEPAHYHLIELYALAGQRTAALRQYQECRRCLDEAWGIRPSDETTALHERIARGELRADPDYGAPHQASAVQQAELVQPPAYNIPPLPTLFVGREAELEQIAGYLRDPQRRLITLIGPGGIGKTRLALQAAHRAVVDALFEDGVYFVDLKGVTSPDFLVTTIANALEFPLSGSEEAGHQLLAHLRKKRILLILDNFEHLIKRGAGLVARILQAAGAAHLLVTSRESLNLVEEWLLEVQGLPYPEVAGEEDAHYDSVALFVSRAQQAVADFRLSTSVEELRAAHRICRLVEGMPLGIELAATWVKLLPCTQIAQEIRANLDFLTTAHQNVPERHRGLRAVFEHSWELLAQEEREALAQISVFRGHFTREAVVHVTQADLRRLANLIDKSLLRRTKEGQYSLHELLRQYASEKLHADTAMETLVRDRHAEHYALFVRQQHQFWDSQREQAACAQIQAEIENVRDGWLWASSQQNDTIVEMYLECLLDFYTTMNWLQEGKSIFDQAITALTSDSPAEPYRARLLARLYACQARFCHDMGLFDQVQHLSHKSLGLFGEAANDDDLAFIYELLGAATYYQGDPLHARQLLQTSLRHARRIDDYARTAHVLLSYAVVELKLEDYDTAKRVLQEGLAIYQRINKQWGVAYALRFLALVAQAEGDLHQAQELHQHSLFLFQEIDNTRGVTYEFSSLGAISSALDRYDDAQYYYQSALDTALAGQTMPVILQVLLGVAGMLLRRNSPVKAREIQLNQERFFGSEPATAFLLLSFVLQHPAANQETKTQARASLVELTTMLPPYVVGALQKQAKGQELQDLVQAVSSLNAYRQTQ